MPKIATITFHWANNYGAVLQAYSLQKYIQILGYTSEIINYIPLRVRYITIISELLHGDFSSIFESHYFAPFRKNELCISREKYSCYTDLKRCSYRYNMIICGSDQIWNRSFTCHAENGPTLSYFLGFADPQTTRIAYAVSFGADQMPEEYLKIASPEVKKFKAVSVREKTGISIAESLGVKAKLVCDPTLLLEKEDYKKIIAGRSYKKRKVFSYILHKKQKTAFSIFKYVDQYFSERATSLNKRCDVYEWIYHIANASMVVTNSFHGVMMSLIMNTPFIVIPVEGKNMNNRIETILDEVGLKERMIDTFDPERINNILMDNIDWKIVNNKLNDLREYGRSYLRNNMEYQ